MQVPSSSTARTASSPSRRTVLKGSVAGAAAVGVAPSVMAASPAETYAEQLFLLDRATWGFHPGDVDDIRALGYDGWLDWQLDWESIDDTAAEGAVRAVAPTVDMTPWEIQSAYQGLPDLPVQMAQLTYPLRGWFSKRQLYYRMCEFWTNVFSTYSSMMDQEWLWTPYNQTLIPHALGNFRDLLQASAEGASMLYYLNQDQSNKDSPIENYARELLELHTLGLSDDPANPTFEEQDMVEAARILTGWTFKDVDNPNYGDFKFTAADHDTNPKTFLGVTYPSTGGPGKPEGDDLLTQLANDPNTAIHIANRLIGHFIMDDPPQGYRDSVARAFHDSGGDIKTTVRALFKRGIYQLPNRVKTRRPLYLITAFLRATQPTLTGPSLVTHVQRMGQSPSQRPTPDGYPTRNEEWYDNLHPRLVFLAAASHGYAGVKVSDARLDELFPPGGGGLAEQANRALAGGALPAIEVQAIQQTLDALPPEIDARRDALALTFSAPSYQLLFA